MRISFLCTLLLCAVATLQGQEFRGTFSGKVTDPQGAPAPKARILATETRTGTKATTVSDDAGDYILPFLAPGIYEISAEAQGFKKFVQQNITLSAGEHPVVDVHLTLGAVSETVTVSEGLPPLVVASPSVGQVFSTAEVEDLPLNGRTPMMLDNLALGAISTYEPGPVRPFDNTAPNEISLGGAFSGTNEVLLDGAPNAGFSNQMAYSPPQSAVTEVRVTAFEADASYGHSVGGTVDVVSRSGTNSLHGQTYIYNQTSAVDANSFFNNASRTARPPYHQNQYGITAGAPVIIPKVYNGKNKVFWFFAWEGMRDSDPANSPAETGSPVNFATVPTAAERTGDFSALLPLGTVIYNPYTATQSGSTISRSPFPGNVIPTNLLNPVAQSLLQFFPSPDNPNAKSNGLNNYIVNAVDSDGYDNEFGRVDFNLSEKNRLNIDGRHNYRRQNKGNYFDDIATGNYLYRINQGATADDVWTISPTMFTDVRLDWTRYMEIHASPNDGYNITSLGFPPSIAAAAASLQLPYITFVSTSVTAGSEESFQNLGYNSDGPNTYDAFQLFGDVVKIHGNHTIKAGGDLRRYVWSAYSAGTPAGSYTFGSTTAGNNWTNGPTTAASLVFPGQDLAAFMLGLPSSGSITVNTRSTTGSMYGALFIQDDWRVRSDLTLNLGLRFEHETPSSERYNRAVDGFDPAAANSASPGAEAALATALAAGTYKGTALASFSPGTFGLGGLTFASSSNPDIYQTNSHVFSPRLGFAWTPKALGGGKTVIRGGFAMFAAPIEILGNGSIGTSYTALALQQQGFSQTTQMTVTNNTYLTPATTLSNPFPGGVLPASGSSLGASTFLGQQIQYFNPDVRNPYSLRWNLGIQRQLPGQMVLEVAYIGSHSEALPISQVQLDYIPRQYLSTLQTRDAATISLLTGTVTNPFKGLLPNSSSLNGSTVALDQLLAPYPQFPVGAATSNGILEDFVQSGESYYNSLNVRLQKRMSHGLLLINNFVWNNMMERMDYLNDSDPSPEKRISVDSRPLREVMAASYQLPIGSGRQVNIQNRWVNALAGGWLFNPVLTLQSGPPIAWGTGISAEPLYYGGPLNLNPNQPNGAAFNTSLFNTATAQQLADNIRSFSSQFGDLRRAPSEELDLSMDKRFVLGRSERRFVALRIEAYNVTNHVTFGAPNVTPTSSAFGEITTQANTPRRIQTAIQIFW